MIRMLDKPVGRLSEIDVEDFINKLQTTCLIKHDSVAVWLENNKFTFNFVKDYDYIMDRESIEKAEFLFEVAYNEKSETINYIWWGSYIIQTTSFHSLVNYIMSYIRR